MGGEKGNFTNFTNTLHKVRPLLMIWESACCDKAVLIFTFDVR